MVSTHHCADAQKVQTGQHLPGDCSCHNTLRLQLWVGELPAVKPSAGGACELEVRQLPCPLLAKWGAVRLRGNPAFQVKDVMNQIYAIMCEGLSQPPAAVLQVRAEYKPGYPRIVDCTVRMADFEAHQFISCLLHDDRERRRSTQQLTRMVRR